MTEENREAHACTFRNLDVHHRDRLHHHPCGDVHQHEDERRRGSRPDRYGSVSGGHWRPHPVHVHGGKTGQPYYRYYDRPLVEPVQPYGCHRLVGIRMASARTAHSQAQKGRKAGQQANAHAQPARPEKAPSQVTEGTTRRRGYHDHFTVTCCVGAPLIHLTSSLFHTVHFPCSIKTPAHMSGCFQVLKNSLFSSWGFGFSLFSSLSSFFCLGGFVTVNNTVNLLAVKIKTLQAS